ncbi:hypothetical protein [Couchioplanes caeruleus]|uniref:Uncharacterized protein n=2 Tax=Couchioplanes caeruleus TaxID=56438 RepID=A0A1K0GPU9_9ACTN|nr:hypothetical protein [Couchioplanes caeruleus]OJF13196.1 hypothetical protein BG844_16410 [Couchioplanes caeruleus subsp. caeruleus]ROP27755.1 hypothetical protein EDD30_0450 [Couchioplanes caeruleus]
MEIIGYGTRLTATGAIQIGRVGGEGTHPDALISASTADGQLSNNVVTVDGGRAGLAQAPGAGGLRAVAEPAADDQPYWSLSQAGMVCRWPEGVRVVTADPGAGVWSTELHGDNGALVMLRGPRCAGGGSVPPPDHLIGPGQELLSSDMSAEEMWLELGYVRDGETWWQRHQYAVLAPGDLLVVTGQAPAGNETGVRRVVDVVARSLRLDAPRPRRRFFKWR